MPAASPENTALKKENQKPDRKELCLESLRVGLLIHTGLQPGVSPVTKLGNRFNGFSVRQLT